MANIQHFMGSPTAPVAAESGANGFTTLLDAQPQVNATMKMGTQGYCMGGALVLRTVATAGTRIGAEEGACGGGLVTDKPGMPHWLASQIKARIYIAFASNDDARRPEAKDKLRQAFASATVMAEIEVYAGARHGWCVADMSPQSRQPIYSMANVELAWSKLTGLYQTTLNSWCRALVIAQSLRFARKRRIDPAGKISPAAQITLSHGRERRIAQLMMPTME